MGNIAPFFRRLSPKPCSYLPEGPQERFIAIDEAEPIFWNNEIQRPKNSAAKFVALEKGFLGQAFGTVAPICPTCRACVPLRTNISKFRITKSQRRITGENTKFTFQLTKTDTVNVRMAFDLYQKYMRQRHNEKTSSMKSWPLRSFESWFQAAPFVLLALRNNSLAGFSLIDSDGKSFSLDYSVFNPEFSKESPGKQLWIQTMLLAERNGIQQVYVGSWAKGSPKTGYKEHFKGLETIVDGTWKDFNPQTHTQGPNYHQLLRTEGLNI